MIKARALVKRYDDFTAVDSIDFEIEKGECYGFLGPNGAGKTTTMRLIYRASPITSGSLVIAGLDASTGKYDRQIKSRIGVIAQENNLDIELSVGETLIVFCRFYGIYGQAAEKRKDALLDLVDLRQKEHARIHQLSGGMKRRVLIARSLIGNPEILVLDEPTTGLDPQARHKLWDKLHLIKENGTTLVLTTHYMVEAEAICDRLSIMDGGKIIAEGNPQELIDQHESTGAGGEAPTSASPLERVFLKITQQHEDA